MTTAEALTTLTDAGVPAHLLRGVQTALAEQERRAALPTEPRLYAMRVRLEPDVVMAGKRSNGGRGDFATEERYTAARIGGILLPCAMEVDVVVKPAEAMQMRANVRVTVLSEAPAPVGATPTGQFAFTVLDRMDAAPVSLREAATAGTRMFSR